MKKTIKKVTKKIQKKVVNKLQKKIQTNKTSHIVIKKLPIQPLGNRVLIRPFLKSELVEKNNFGIILPGSDNKEKAEQGTVLAVGIGGYQDGVFVPTSVSVGDVVAFSKYGYDDITVDSEELYLIKEENILAVINK